MSTQSSIINAPPGPSSGSGKKKNQRKNANKMPQSTPKVETRVVKGRPKQSIRSMKFGLGSALYKILEATILSLVDPCGSQGLMSENRIPDGSVANSGNVNSRDLVVESTPAPETSTMLQKRIRMMRYLVENHDDLVLADTKDLKKKLETMGLGNIKFPMSRKALASIIKALKMFQDPVPLDGTLNSYCYFEIQGLRINTIVWMKSGGGSFGSDDRVAFCNAWNNTVDFRLASFPRWYPVGFDNMFYQVHFNPAFVNLALPETDRTSADIAQHRNDNSGVEIFVNQPDLINQGAYVTGQIPLRYTHITPTGSSAPLANAVYSIVSVTATDILMTFTWGTPANPVLDTLVTPAPMTATRPCLLDVRIQDPANPSKLIDFASSGDSLIIEFTSFTLTVTNTVTSDSFVMSQVSSVGTVVKPTFLGSNAYVLLGENDFSLIQLPPSEESLLAQLDSKVTAGQISKCEGAGKYVRANLHQPVLTWQVPSERRPIRFIVPGMDRAIVDNSPGGFSDTLDLNFNVITFLLLNVSAAARPIKKTIRNVEIVANSGSVYAPFMHPSPEACTQAVEIARTIMDLTPHSYDADYNSTGILSNKLKKLVSIVAPALHTGVNVTDLVIKALGSVGL